MCWYAKATKPCKKRGYELLDHQDDGWYMFVKKDGAVIPLTEGVINRWVVEDFVQ